MQDCDYHWYRACYRLASRHSLEEEICSPCNTLITLYTLRMPELLPRLATPDVALYAAHWQVSSLALQAGGCQVHKGSLDGRRLHLWMAVYASHLLSGSCCVANLTSGCQHLGG